MQQDITQKADQHTALLSNEGDMASFRFGGQNIRFKAPYSLVRYTEVKEWDDGYLVVKALYDGPGETEDYIDLRPILDNLCINADEFLKPIKRVEVSYD